MSVPTPQLDKMHEVKEQSQAIGGFLEWLRARGIALAEWKEHRHTEDCRSKQGFIVCNKERDEDYLELADLGSLEEILALYFEIDLEAAEQERVALLNELRERTSESLL